MSCNTTRQVEVRIERAMDLSRTISRTMKVPPGALSARLIATRLDANTWGGSITVEGADGPLSSDVSLADPTAAVLDSVATVGVDELDGVRELRFIPPASGSGSVMLRAIFTVSSPSGDERP